MEWIKNIWNKNLKVSDFALCNMSKGFYKQFVSMEQQPNKSMVVRK